MTIKELDEWNRNVFAWNETVHKTLREAMERCCGACRFRTTFGCIGNRCPVHRSTTDINKTAGRIARANKYAIATFRPTM